MSSYVTLFGVGKETTKGVPDECTSFVKHTNLSLVKEIKHFDCASNSECWSCLSKSCDGLIKSGNGKPWYASKGRENSSRINIYFYRTLMISRIDLEQVESDWFNKIILGLGYRDQRVVTLSKGRTKFWSSIKIDPPSCITEVDIYPLTNDNVQATDNKPKKYGIKNIRFYGVRMEAACKIVESRRPKIWGKYITLDCDEEEICIQSSGKCVKGCQHSDQCNSDEYCNLKTYQCRRGELECGKRLMGSSARIRNGEESEPHGLPWIVALNYCNFCAGTLISDKHVLTAAHCLMYGGVREVVLGDHDCEKYELGQMSVKVKKSHSHPRFWVDESGTLSAYDIAVLTLEKPVRFSSTILPACLPYQPSKVYVNRSATAAGWGYDFPNEDQSRLKKVDLTILPMKECQSATWIIKVHKKMNITKDVNLINESYALCAGRYKETKVSYNYTGLEAGDSGGPLILKDKKTGLNTVIGVAAVAPADQSEYDGGPYFIYSDVEKFLPWILGIINV